mgnify:CR=1 FL=1
MGVYCTGIEIVLKQFYFSLQSWINSEVRMDSVPQMGEETVVFRQGHLVQGVLDKNHYGASLNGLVHSCYEVRFDLYCYVIAIASDL